MATAAMTFASVHLEIRREDTSRHARDLRSRVHQALQRGTRHFVVDCAAWSVLDFAVLSSLIQCAAACREYGASFEIANISHELQADLRSLQLSERLGVAR